MMSTGIDTELWGHEKADVVTQLGSNECTFLTNKNQATEL